MIFNVFLNHIINELECIMPYGIHIISLCFSNEVLMNLMGGGGGASVSQSSEQASFTSEIVGWILATDSCEKCQSTLCPKSWVFSGCSGFLHQGKLIGWVRINTVRK